MQKCQTIPATSFNRGHPGKVIERLSVLGFDHWIYSAIPNYHDNSNIRVNRVSSYPDGFIESYNQLDFARVDPFTPYWFKHDDPTSFRKVRQSAILTPRQRELMSLNADFAVNKGVVLPLKNVKGFKAVLALSFDGSLAELNAYIGTIEKELYELGQRCNQGFLRQHKELFFGNNSPQLTSRQQEVMLLLVNGKLTKQISDILSISQNAVDKHIAKIKTTLSARTTPEAVALALQWNLI